MQALPFLRLKVKNIDLKGEWANILLFAWEERNMQPNWIENKICIKGDVKALSDLERKVKEWVKSEYAPNTFHGNWLGNIVGNSGIDDMSEGDFKVFCRGTLKNISVSEDGSLEIEYLTAWKPSDRMWIMLADKYLDDVTSMTFSAYDRMNNLSLERCVIA